MSYNLFHLLWLPIDGIIWKRKDGSELNRDRVGDTEASPLQRNDAAWGCSNKFSLPALLS